MAEDLVINEQITIPGSELRVSFARSGGPGGQHVNKVETKVELRWTPSESAAFSGSQRQRLLERLSSSLTSTGELLVTSSRTRDQSKNREDARAKLVQVVRQALRRPKKRRSTRPSRRAVEQRLKEKKEKSQVKKQRRPPDPGT